MVITEMNQTYFKKVLTNGTQSAIKIKQPEKRYAGVAELADARDLKSRGTQIPYRFDPGFRHQLYRGVEQLGSSSGS